MIQSRNSWVRPLLVTRYPYTLNILREPRTSKIIPSEKLNSILPPYTAASFHTKLIPRKIISSKFSLSPSSTQPRKSPKPLRPISLVTGKDGEHSSHTQASRKNHQWNPTRRQENHGVIIHSISVKKPVCHNNEIKTPPRNHQGRCIICIYVLPDTPSGRPDSRRIRKNIPYTKWKLQGYKSVKPPTKKQ